MTVWQKKGNRGAEELKAGIHDVRSNCSVRDV